jgi:hypothetical protein
MSRDQVHRELQERRASRDAKRRTAECYWRRDELTEVWRAAQTEATAAYDHWREVPGRDAYSVYRAAQDRADEAQDDLWQQHLLETTADTGEAWLA